MMKPRILLLSTAYLPLIGGSELAMKHIAEHCTDFDFDIITGRFNEDPKVEQMGRVRVFRVGGAWSRFAFGVPKVLLPFAICWMGIRLMRRQRYTAVHAYQASQAAGAGMLLRWMFPSVPFLVTVQEGKDLQEQHVLVRLARRAILRRADAITTISRYLADTVRRDAPRVPIAIIPNGVDRVAIPPRLPTIGTGTRIVTVSRLVEKNNVEGILRALPHILRVVPDATVTIVGEGHLRSHLERVAEELRIAGIVHFAGMVPPEHLVHALHDADVFVRPSFSEGLGSAYLEAMAARLPIVASAVGGIPDIITDGVTGLFCDPHQPSDIAEKVVTLLTDTRMRDRIIDESYRFVQDYDWSHIAQRMSAVYHRYLPS